MTASITVPAGPGQGRWWRICAGCGMQRRLKSLDLERMVTCNRWDAGRGDMVKCEGSGNPPAVPAVAGTVSAVAS